jgi:hypothetical protein
MNKKENQHFVPKFYLRLFSYENNGKEIGVFNMNTKFFMSNAKLKTQGSKPYFYGKDGNIEEALSGLERAYSKILKDIITSKIIPCKNSTERYLLFQFVVLMSIRNPIIPRNIEDSFKVMSEILKSKGPCNLEMLKGLETNQQESLNFGFQNILLYTNYCLDLDIKIFFNNTTIPFLISDNPVVKYNQYLEKRRYPGGNSGYASTGLQIFIPIDPKLLLVFYDPWAYKIGPRKHSIISIDDPIEIFQLNLLQFVNCDKIIFFNHQMQEYQIQKLFEASTRIKKANLPITKEYPLMVHKEDKISRENVIVMTTTNCETKLNLNTIKETSQGKSYKLDNKAVHMRKWAANLRNK